MKKIINDVIVNYAYSASLDALGENGMKGKFDCKCNKQGNIFEYTMERDCGGISGRTVYDRGYKRINYLELIPRL